MTVKATCLVGLDVHARQTHATLLDRATGELSACRLRGTPEEAVLPYLERIGRDLLAVYEAGPTGFGLAREAERRGLDVRVVAPGSIPRAPGDRVKTDSRDSRKLLRQLAAGELTFAFVPSEEDEAFRDLIRGIEDLRGDLMRARHRLSKFLLRRGHRYQDGHAWTPKHGRWLRSLSFDGCAQATFADYCASVELLVGRRRTLLETLEQAVPGCTHAPTIGRLRCFRGIETLSAAGVCAETGGFDRFHRPTLLSGFLGIVPSERTSDLKRRQGSITKAGSPHARRLLVEAAQHYRKQPAIGQTLARRQAGQDPRVIEIAWRAQQRLHQRWQRLYHERRKPAGVVAIAVARELAGFLWEAATLDA
ncbi:MAG: IS110 family transposase [Solirubrobacterales bacterium]|nr:IS110 family transposase [Solirubrobacterales bacterium]